jgi:hypothetical protein
MKPLQREYEALEKILRRAYYEKESAEVGEQWHQEVMRRIRGLGPIETGTNFFMLFGQFFWRLTPATCILIFISAALLLKLDFTPEYDMFASLISYAEEVTLVHLFGF